MRRCRLSSISSFIVIDITSDEIVTRDVISSLLSSSHIDDNNRYQSFLHINDTRAYEYCLSSSLRSMLKSRYEHSLLIHVLDKSWRDLLEAQNSTRSIELNIKIFERNKRTFSLTFTIFAEEKEDRFMKNIFKIELTSSRRDRQSWI